MEHPRGGKRSRCWLRRRTWRSTNPVGALILLTVLLLAWIIPHQRAALTFTEAEVAFLFPAPISRRGLIHFKLLRSQIAILFTTLLLTLVTHRFGGKAWIHAAGWWLILSTLSLHTLGSSFARTMLLDRGITNWQRRLVILALVLVLAGAVIVWSRQTMPAFDLSRFENMQDVQDYAQQVLTAGPLPYLLYPVRLVVRPYLAPNALAFLYAFGPALLLVLVHYAWVVRSNVAFEEASVGGLPQTGREGRRRARGQLAGRAAAGVKSRRPPFKLRPTGPPGGCPAVEEPYQRGPGFHLTRVAEPGGVCGCVLRSDSDRPQAAPAFGRRWG